MPQEWQTWAALGIVAATAVIMLYRLLARRKGACNSGCGCDAKKPIVPLKRTQPNFQKTTTDEHG